MKKYLVPILLFIILCTSAFAQERWNQDPRLMSILGNGDKNTNVEPNYNSMNYVNPNTQINVVNMIDGVAIVYPNKRVHPSPYVQSEVPIVSHPTNKNIIFGSCNFFKYPSFFSEGVYVTTDGGDNWFGWDTLRANPINNHIGDPAPSIAIDNRFYESYLQLSGSHGVYVSTSTDFGNTWANATLVTSAGSDKNHTFTINNPSSPYNGNTIVSWSNWVTNPNIAVSVTSDNGTTWSPMISVQTPPEGVFSQGVNGCQGPDGEAYLIWQSPMSSSPFTGKYCGFAKSTNGGFNWTANNNIFACNGIRGNLINGIRINDFPWMGCDLSNGTRRGWLYVVTAEKGLAPAGNDADIVFHRSTDGGTTWSTGIRVNQDELNNGRFQYMPSLVVGTDGSVNVVYYDNRNTPNGDSVEVYVARSIDGGDNWQEIKVSDHKFKPAGITGLAPGYQGDYIGIAEGPSSSLYPYWADNSSGIYQAWTTKVIFYTYPLNPFNLTAPAAGSTITSLPNTSTNFNFQWDTAASTASYKWRFVSGGVTKLEIPTSFFKYLTFTSSQLDNILASLGLNQGDSLVGTWNVMAYRNNMPQNDSLAAANGPRPLTLKRGKPLLTAFNLNSPANGSTIITSAINNSPLTFKWTKSGDAVKYKVKWGQTLTNLLINTYSGNSGFDTTWIINNNSLDFLLKTAGLNQGESINGLYTVYAYSVSDSLKSVQTFNITIKRQEKGDWLIAYDSTNALGIASRDSVIYYMGLMGKTFDVFNKGTQSSVNAMSFPGFKGIVWLGQGSSVMSHVQKDSVKSFLNSGTPGNKANLIIFSEDIGWTFDRSGYADYDSSFARQYLGFKWLLDNPISGGNQGLIGDAINFNIADSTVGPYPDVIQPSWNGGERLYKFRSQDTDGNAVGSVRDANNVVVFASDVRSLRRASDSPSGSTILRLLQGAFTYVDPTPVELTSFTASSKNNDVNLLWSTATETNNHGFVVERKSGGSRFIEIGFVPGKGTSTEIHTYSFTDKMREGIDTYRLKQVDFNGSINYSKEIEVTTVTVYSLEQNYPNPFNPGTVIKYSILQDGLVTLQVFNVLGQKVMTLVNQNMKAGKYEVNFNASNLASGIYFYRLDAGDFTSVRKMMLVK